MNSLDILEECLDTIYKVRKQSIEYRARKFQKRSQRIGGRSKPTASSPFTKNKPLTTDKDDSDTEDDEEDEEDNKLQTSSLPSKKKVVKPSKVSLATSIGSLPTDSSSTETESNAANQGKRITGSDGFQLMQSQKNDYLATSAYEDFCGELHEWWMENLALREDDEARERCADYMSDKYMCQRLDPLPASRVVTQVRRNISQVIDEFATQGVVPPEVQLLATERRLKVQSESETKGGTATLTDTRLSHEKQLALAKEAKKRLMARVTGSHRVEGGGKTDTGAGGAGSTADKDADSSVSVSSSGKGSISTRVSFAAPKNIMKMSSIPAEGKPIPTATAIAATVPANKSISGNVSEGVDRAAQRREEEKIRIKKQYEQFMALKSRTEGHPDAEKTQLYEENMDDIRTLISNLRGGETKS